MRTGERDAWDNFIYIYIIIPFKAIFRVSLVFIYFFLSLVSVHLCDVCIYIYMKTENSFLSIHLYFDHIQ